MPEHRLQPAGQRLIGEQRVEIDRRLGHADAVPVGRDAAMEIGQRLAVIEPAAFRHEGFDQAQDAVGAVDEAGQRLTGRRRSARGLVKPASARAASSAGGR